LQRTALGKSVDPAHRWPMDDFEQRVREALADPQNQGEMADADAVGTVGSPECGDMLRMWLKFTDKDGRRVIDRASFQAFGCQTAIAVASMATELLRGKTVDEARQLGAHDLSGELGPLPPMKVHCGQLVEGALHDALGVDSKAAAGPLQPQVETLDRSVAGVPAGRVRVIPLVAPADPPAGN